jgi:RNA polymerase sigma-70 factor (ECF subfamily)
MLPVMAQEPDDVALMLRYRSGDVAAFDALYARHRGPLYRYFLRHCREPALAADLFQETWARIVRARLDYRPTARFATYMYQIAHNCLVDHHRRTVRRPLADGEFDPERSPADEAPGPEALAMSSQAADQFRAALESLPGEQRDAFLLHEAAGLSLAEIAEVTGVHQEAVKSRLRYALKKLRATLVATEVLP